jgi:hypothetical protein
LRTIHPYFFFFFTIPKLRAEKRTTAVLLRVNLADVEFRLGVSTAQFSDVRWELADTKTLLTDTQVTFLEA